MGDHDGLHGEGEGAEQLGRGLGHGHGGEQQHGEQLAGGEHPAEPQRRADGIALDEPLVGDEVRLPSFGDEEQVVAAGGASGVLAGIGTDDRSGIDPEAPKEPADRSDVARCREREMS